MKAKIISSEIKEVDGSIILCMTYSYKGFESMVSLIDLQDRVKGEKSLAPTWKELKQFIKTTENAINTEIKAKEDSESKLKKEMKQKQTELDAMRAFVNSRTVNWESTKRAIEEFKKLNK